MASKASAAHAAPDGKSPSPAAGISASNGTTSSNGCTAGQRVEADAETSHGRTTGVSALLSSATELPSPGRLSANEAKVGMQTVLRVATRVALAGAAPGPAANTIAWPEMHVVDRAARTLRHFIGAVGTYECPLAYGALVDLWSRPGPSIALVKALAVALRRADDAAVEAGERRAYYELSVAVLESFSHAAESAADSREAHPLLHRTARALARSGVLQCLGRFCAAGNASRGTGDLAYNPLLLLRTALCFLHGLLAVTVYCTGYADDSARSGGRPTDPNKDLLDALADSHLLEHAAKCIWAGDMDGYLPSRPLLSCLRLMLCQPARRAMVHESQLPGPCQHFLLTAAAVDALGALDSGPRYGLPDDVAQRAKVLRQRLGTRPQVAIQDVLRCWVLLQTPGAGMPLRSCISPAATYELCMRACATSVRAALDSGGETGAGWCHTAVAALVAAHDALEQRRQQQQAPSAAAAGSRASPGPLRDRPHGWWQAGVEALLAVAEATPEELRGVEGLLGDAELLLSYQLDRGALSLPLPGALRLNPPADVASALSSGYLPCLERILRRSPNGRPMLPTLPTSLLRWPQLRWLLAYGDRRQAAALVATLGKLLWLLTCAGMLKGPGLDVPRRAVQLSLDSLDWLQARRKALTAAGGGGEGPGSSNSGAGSSGSNGRGGASSSGIGDDGSDSDGCGAGSSTAAGMGDGGGSSGDGSVASSSGTRGPAPPPEEDAASGQQLRLMVGYMLTQWLPRLTQCGRVVMFYQESKVVGGSATTQRDEPSIEFIRNLLRLVKLALHSCSHEMPPAEKDAWGQLLFKQANIMGFLDAVAAYAALGFLQPLEVLQLRRLLRQLLASYPAAMHTELCKVDGTAFRTFLNLFGPSGTRPDPQLVGLLEAARTGGAAGGAEVPPPPPGPRSSGLSGSQPLLPPLLEVQSLLRVCGNVSCINFGGNSEAGVKLRKGSGSGGWLWFCGGKCEQQHRAFAAQQGQEAKVQRKEGGGRRKGR